MLKIRCKYHVALGIGLPWLGGWLCLTGAILYIAYQYLQFNYRSRLWPEHRACVDEDIFKDDSYLDIKEMVIPLIISGAVMKILEGVLL